ISTEEYIKNKLIQIISWRKENNFKINDKALNGLFTKFRIYKIYGLDESLIAKVASTEERFHVFEKALKKEGYKLNKDLLGKKIKGLTKIATAEPSQKSRDKYNDFNKYNFCDKSGTIQLSDCWDEGQNSFSRFLETYLTKRNKSESDVGRTNQDIFDRELMRLLKEFETYNLDPNKIYSEINGNIKLKNFLNNSNVKFTKTEPTIKPKKKVKVAKAEKEKKIVNLKFCQTVPNIEVYGISTNAFIGYDASKSYPCENHISYEEFKEKTTKKDWFYCYNEKTKLLLNKHTIVGLGYGSKKCLNNKNDYSIYPINNSDKFYYLKNTQTKIAKVEEPKQEEFKPETGDIDNDAPIIEIAEAITVDSQAYTLKGKVKDKSQIYLTIDGRQVQVKKGKFELERFNIDPDNAEEIKIVAIDKWNNRAEKTVKVTIDLQSTDVARVYEDLNPNNVRAKTDNNKIAIIIGIEKYENLTNLDAKYANRDAKAFKAYATRALGIKPYNIKMLIDDKAKRGNTLEAFKIWLPKMAGKGDKDIYIFFAGHGLASENGKDLYVLPQDGNAKLLDDTAITRLELISLIKKVNPKSVTMFFDTCYSGQTRDEEMLVASLLRPIQIIPEEQDTPDNFTIFSASNYDQVSGGIEEAKHGMFSYYLMLGLEGNADENKDKKITNGELIAYLKDNVSLEALTQNREQDPMLAGDPDKVLMSYR
ncbi:caspase family protein, partial [Candidatus Pelagibacter sp.]|nr:caspase family protein [Candidatus Pelagibacter sp.]